jgi:hypothetical protein
VPVILYARNITTFEDLGSVGMLDIDRDLFHRVHRINRISEVNQDELVKIRRFFDLGPCPDNPTVQCRRGLSDYQKLSPFMKTRSTHSICAIAQKKKLKLLDVANSRSLRPAFAL